MLSAISGLDHVVILVRDLDAAAASWRRLGFTVSPRGLHSPHLGTGNHTIMLGEDYIELLGIVAETAHNAPSRAALAEREGVERLAFTARDAAALAAELDGLPREGVVGLILRVGDLERAFRAVEGAVGSEQAGLSVREKLAGGVALHFVQG